MKYDYIIAGAGCAGLSLLYKILLTPSLQDKSILVVDKDEKKSNDRTWCFWESNPGLFESIVHARWSTLEFISDNFKKEMKLDSYNYKMIQGIDFYNFIHQYAKKFKNVKFIQESITAIKSSLNEASVTTNQNTYISDYVFNSTSLLNPKINEQNSLLQHFKGWNIKTKDKAFNPKIGRLMDFSLSQKNGATFMYVLPTSSTEALIEYTLFSASILNKESYVDELKKYIKDVLKIDHYTIEHEEFGIIPMSLEKFKNNPKKFIINIGTSGGYTKASTGYTFQFIQKNISKIVENLIVDKYPVQSTTFRDKVYQWYDRTLLDVLLNKKISGKKAFTKIFKRNTAKNIFAFLGNESTLKEDFLIMKSLPIKPFLASGIKQLF